MNELYSWVIIVTNSSVQFVMPNPSRYANLGPTTALRIPVNCTVHFQNLLRSYNTLCGTHGPEKVTELQERIEQGIDNYLDKIE